MSTPVSIGLIGADGFGIIHRQALASHQREGLIRLTAVADPNLDRMPSLKSELLSSGTRLYHDYREMLDREKSLTAVTIATPIPLHYEMTSACLQHGLYVYLEKPPAPTMQQLENLIALDKRQRVYVGFQQIGSAWIQQIKTWITHGMLGDIQSLRACACWPRRDSYYNRASWAGKMVSRNQPVFDGPATNALAHLIHNIMYLAAPRPESFDVPARVQGELYRARPIDSYDTSCLRGEFPSGITFSAALTHATREEMFFHLRVQGTKGWAHLSQDGQRLESSLGNHDYPGETVDLIYDSYRHFVDYMEGQKQAIVTRLVDTRGYVQATNAALFSSDGIHDIAPEWKQLYQIQNDQGYDIPGFHGLATESFQSGLLFSELSCPWATLSHPVSTDSIKGLQHELLTPKIPSAQSALTYSA